MSMAKSARLFDKGSSASRKAWWSRYLKSMKYAFTVITHPFDGFWDLGREQKGTVAAANTYLFLFLLTRVIKLLYTNFQFINAPTQYINVLEETLSLLIPFLILCIANWAMTTLFDGKGRFRDIYVAMCYALVPYVLIQLPLVLVSRMIAFDESSFYTVLMTISIIWCVLLVFVGLMEVHDYSPFKTLIFLVFTVVGAGVILFLLLTFFSLLSDAIAYFVSIYREIIYRLY